MRQILFFNICLNLPEFLLNDSFRHSFGKLYSYQLLQMRTSETFTTGYFSREKQLLEKMKQNSTNGYVHQQALAAILRMPTDTANSPVALIDVHSFRVT